MKHRAAIATTLFVSILFIVGFTLFALGMRCEDFVGFDTKPTECAVIFTGTLESSESSLFHNLTQWFALLGLPALATLLFLELSRAKSSKHNN